MAARSKQLTAVQIGVESTWGTAVAQTAKLPHIDEFSPKPEVTSNRYMTIGDLAAGTQNAVTKTYGSASMSGRANYGTLPLWLQNLFGVSTDAGADPYTHTHEFSTTAAPTRKFYTLVKSDGTDAVALVGALITEYTLTATPGEAVKESITWVGKQVSDGTVTAGQSDFTDADQLLRPSELTVYLDPVGSAGSTALDCDAVSVELKITATTPMQFGLGTIEACDYTTSAYDITLALSVEASNATAKTHVESLLGSSPTATPLDVQLTFTKSANYAWTAIIPMVLSEAPTWHSDVDGVLTWDTNLHVVKNSSSSATGSFFDSVVTNTDAVV